LKRKGCNLERELVSKFWKYGWAAIRVAGSGSSSFPSPDIIAGKNNNIYAIECKSCKAKKFYFKIEQLNSLLEFSKKIGAKPMLGLRFSKKEWYFIPTKDLKNFHTTNKFFVINRKELAGKAIKITELINGQRQSTLV
jgi:Holliday junction resolvase